MPEPIVWTRSSKCSGGQCVEVAKVGDQYLIRDSKNSDAGSLTFDEAGWTAFMRGVAAGEFDR